MKIDLKREIATYRATRGRFDDVVVAPANYLMIDGHGDPNTAAAYRDALATLFPAAYAVKFLSKNELDRDYTVPPLEALWWAEEMDLFTTSRDKSAWDWTVLSRVPDWLTAEHVAQAGDTAAAKRDLPMLDALRFEMLDEGRSVQTLHVGDCHDFCVSGHG